MRCCLINLGPFESAHSPEIKDIIDRLEEAGFPKCNVLQRECILPREGDMVLKEENCFIDIGHFNDFQDPKISQAFKVLEDVGIRRIPERDIWRTEYHLVSIGYFESDMDPRIKQIIAMLKKFGIPKFDGGDNEFHYDMINTYVYDCKEEHLRDLLRQLPKELILAYEINGELQTLKKLLTTIN